MNFTKITTNNRLLLAILFSLLSVVLLESVAAGDLLNAPKGPKLSKTQRARLGDKLSKVADKTPRELLAGKGGLSKLQKVPGGADVDSTLADLARRAKTDDVARRTLKELKKLVPKLGLD